MFLLVASLASAQCTVASPGRYLRHQFVPGPPADLSSCNVVGNNPFGIDSDLPCAVYMLTGNASGANIVLYDAGSCNVTANTSFTVASTAAVNVQSWTVSLTDPDTLPSCTVPSELVLNASTIHLRGARYCESTEIDPNTGTLQATTVKAYRSCKPRCSPGYAASVPTLTCVNGALSPATFSCVPVFNTTTKPAIVSEGVAPARCMDGYTTVFIEQCANVSQCNCAPHGYCQKCCKLDGANCKAHKPLGWYLLPAAPAEPQCVACGGGGSIDAVAVGSGCAFALFQQGPPTCVQAADGGCLQPATTACSSSETVETTAAWTALPSTFRLPNTNRVTQLNQGSCGSCYAFAAAHVYASHMNVTAVSPQRHLSCNNLKNNGCEGGTITGTLKDWIKNNQTAPPTCNGTGANGACGSGCQRYYGGSLVPACSMGYSFSTNAVPAQCRQVGKCGPELCEVCVMFDPKTQNCLTQPRAERSAPPFNPCANSCENSAQPFETVAPMGPNGSWVADTVGSTYLQSSTDNVAYVPYSTAVVSAMIRRELVTSGAVGFAYNVYSNFGAEDYKNKAVYVQDAGVKSGGHAVSVFGWDSTMRPAAFVMLNSWGAEWGDRGFFYYAMGQGLSQAEDFGFTILRGPPPPPVTSRRGRELLQAPSPQDTPAPQPVAAGGSVPAPAATTTPVVTPAPTGTTPAPTAAGGAVPAPVVSPVPAVAPAAPVPGVAPAAPVPGVAPAAPVPGGAPVAPVPVVSPVPAVTPPAPARAPPPPCGDCSYKVDVCQDFFTQSRLGQTANASVPPQGGGMSQLQLLDKYLKETVLPKLYSYTGFQDSPSEACEGMLLGLLCLGGADACDGSTGNRLPLCGSACADVADACAPEVLAAFGNTLGAKPAGLARGFAELTNCTHPSYLPDDDGTQAGSTCFKGPTGPFGSGWAGGSHLPCPDGSPKVIKPNKANVCDPDDPTSCRNINGEDDTFNPNPSDDPFADSPNDPPGSPAPIPEGSPLDAAFGSLAASSTNVTESTGCVDRTAVRFFVGPNGEDVMDVNTFISCPEDDDTQFADSRHRRLRVLEMGEELSEEPPYDQPWRHERRMRAQQASPKGGSAKTALSSKQAKKLGNSKNVRSKAELLATLNVSSLPVTAMTAVVTNTPNTTTTYQFPCDSWCPCPFAPPGVLSTIPSRDRGTTLRCTCNANKSACPQAPTGYGYVRTNITIIGCKSGDATCCNVAWNDVCRAGLVPPTDADCLCLGVANYRCPSNCTDSRVQATYGTTSATVAANLGCTAGKGRPSGIVYTELNFTSGYPAGAVVPAPRPVVRASCVNESTAQAQAYRAVLRLSGCARGDGACCDRAWDGVRRQGVQNLGLDGLQCACPGIPNYQCPSASYGVVCGNCFPQMGPRCAGVGAALNLGVHRNSANPQAWAQLRALKDVVELMYAQAATVAGAANASGCTADAVRRFANSVCTVGLTTCDPRDDSIVQPCASVCNEFAACAPALANPAVGALVPAAAATLLRAMVNCSGPMYRQSGCYTMAAPLSSTTVSKPCPVDAVLPSTCVQPRPTVFNGPCTDAGSVVPPGPAPPSVPPVASPVAPVAPAFAVAADVYAPPPITTYEFPCPQVVVPGRDPNALIYNMAPTVCRATVVPGPGVLAAACLLPPLANNVRCLQSSECASGYCNTTAGDGSKWAWRCTPPPPPPPVPVVVPAPVVAPVPVVVPVVVPVPVTPPVPVTQPVVIPQPVAVPAPLPPVATPVPVPQPISCAPCDLSTQYCNVTLGATGASPCVARVAAGASCRPVFFGGTAPANQVLSATQTCALGLVCAIMPGNTTGACWNPVSGRLAALAVCTTNAINPTGPSTIMRRLSDVLGGGEDPQKALETIATTNPALPLCAPGLECMFPSSTALAGLCLPYSAAIANTTTDSIYCPDGMAYYASKCVDPSRLPTCTQSTADCVCTCGPDNSYVGRCMGERRPWSAMRKVVVNVVGALAQAWNANLGPSYQRVNPSAFGGYNASQGAAAQGALQRFKQTAQNLTLSGQCVLRTEYVGGLAAPANSSRAQLAAGTCDQFGTVPAAPISVAPVPVTAASLDNANQLVDQVRERIVVAQSVADVKARANVGPNDQVVTMKFNGDFATFQRRPDVLEVLAALILSQVQPWLRDACRVLFYQGSLQAALVIPSSAVSGDSSAAGVQETARLAGETATLLQGTAFSTAVGQLASSASLAITINQTATASSANATLTPPVAPQAPGSANGTAPVAPPVAPPVPPPHQRTCSNCWYKNMGNCSNFGWYGLGIPLSSVTDQVAFQTKVATYDTVFAGLNAQAALIAGLAPKCGIPYIRRMACGLGFEQCSRTTNQPLKACKSVCEYINTNCAQIILVAGSMLPPAVPITSWQTCTGSVYEQDPNAPCFNLAPAEVGQPDAIPANAMFPAEDCTVPPPVAAPTAPPTAAPKAPAPKIVVAPVLPTAPAPLLLSANASQTVSKADAAAKVKAIKGASFRITMNGELSSYSSAVLNNMTQVIVNVFAPALRLYIVVFFYPGSIVASVVVPADGPAGGSSEEALRIANEASSLISTQSTSFSAAITAAGGPTGGVTVSAAADTSVAVPAPVVPTASVPFNSGAPVAAESNTALYALLVLLLIPVIIAVVVVVVLMKRKKDAGPPVKPSGAV